MAAPGPLQCRPSAALGPGPNPPLGSRVHGALFACQVLVELRRHDGRQLAVGGRKPQLQNGIELRRSGEGATSGYKGLR
ncbi:hypothetical protein NDU88_006132 [Pleurodeles waltl]|uniref:Uncharacterized protein n=1 Tax=Pleurodeles waltl TaxID=8319 RepID=A0AAV7W9Q8_PLEWA|nr:hypothetical protein NDU88_006132 [Pleurodeles waltl]